MVAISFSVPALFITLLSSTVLAAPAAVPGLYPRDFPAPVASSGTPTFVPFPTAVGVYATGTAFAFPTAFVEAAAAAPIGTGPATFYPPALASSFHWPAPTPTADPWDGVVGRTFRFGW